jgi:2,3-bisphosphoglycerate-independent phosphoglycerate mutase
MKETDIALRCNIVTLSEEETGYENRTIIDHSSGEISTEDAAVLLEAVRRELESEEYKFYVGTSYRHLTIRENATVMDLVPPHDILGRKIDGYLPKEEALRAMMEKSYEILNHHPMNEQRAREGKNKANSLWFWGAGTRPALTSFEEKTGKRGIMISAVDLLKGIAIGAGMKVAEVEGADGTLHTNYEGKAETAVDALLNGGFDFAYVHVEAPDEMGHQGSVERKVQAIEYLDERVIRIIKEKMDASGEPYRMLITPDHPTPVALRTHVAEPVPFLIYDSTKEQKRVGVYNENEAKQSGIEVKNGYELMERFLSE